MTKPTCSGTRKDGEPCRVTLNLSETSGLCAAHDPERAERIRQIRESGVAARRANLDEARNAKRNAVPKAPTSLATAERFSAWLVHAVSVGDIDAKAGAVAVNALREFRGAHEKRTLEAEVKRLRAELKKARE